MTLLRWVRLCRLSKRDLHVNFRNTVRFSLFSLDIESKMCKIYTAVLNFKISLELFSVSYITEFYLVCKLKCLKFNRGALVSLICLQILIRLHCFSHSITMEVWKSARWKTAKIHWNEHTPGIYSSFSHTHRNANIGIFVFTAWKQKKSSDKMLPRVGIEPRQPLILSPTLSFLH